MSWVAGVSMESSVISIPAFSDAHKYGNPTACPHFNFTTHGFSLHTSSLFTNNCSLKDFFREAVITWSMSNHDRFYYWVHPEHVFTKVQSIDVLIGREFEQ